MFFWRTNPQSVVESVTNVGDSSTDHDVGALHGAIDRNGGSGYIVTYTCKQVQFHDKRQLTWSCQFVGCILCTLEYPPYPFSLELHFLWPPGKLPEIEHQLRRPQVDDCAEGQDVFPDIFFWMFHDHKGSVKGRSVQFVTVLFFRFSNDLDQKQNVGISKLRKLVSW